MLSLSPPKGGSNTDFSVFRKKIQFQSNKVCYKVKFRSVKTSSGKVVEQLISYEIIEKHRTKSQHGRKSRGDSGDASPPEFGVRGTLIQIVPPDFFMFLNANCQIFALQCSELYMSKLIVMARIQISNTSAYYCTAGLA